jgi:hypothetical protein
VGQGRGPLADVQDQTGRRGVNGYVVVGLGEGYVELWDGVTKIDPSVPQAATMLCPVESSASFEINDKVDIVIVLRERPEKKT